jgi:hypothetical protein
VYRLQDSSGAAPTFLGTVGALPAGASFFFHHSIAVGLVGVVFCVPPRAYVADYAGNPIQQITTGAGDWPSDGASSVAYLDGYYVFSSYTGDRLFVSNILDPTHYNALSYVRMSSTVDYIMKLVAFNGELWVFGQNAITVWYNNGSSTAPFSPRAGATIRHGLGSARTVLELDGSLWWLGVDNCVYRTEGYQAKRVSDHAIEELIADFNDGYLRTAVACGFVHEGHIFYALSLPEAGITLVYDTTTGVWHERSSAADAVGRWNINTATSLGSRGLYGSSLDGKLYEMESGIATEAGVTVPRLAVLPPVVTHGPRASMSRLEVEMEVGTGAPAQRVPRLVGRWRDQLAHGAHALDRQRWRSQHAGCHNPAWQLPPAPAAALRGWAHADLRRRCGHSGGERLMADTATRPPANEHILPGVQQLMSTAWLAYFTSVANRLTGV